MENSPIERRRRGRRPADATERRVQVEAALAQLTAARVPFSMADLAERAGISRATLYRDATLRDLVGSGGDGPKHRPVDSATLRRLENASAGLRQERRELKEALRDSKRRISELEQSVLALENENLARMRAQRDAQMSSEDAERVRADGYRAGFEAGTRAAASRGGTSRSLSGSGGLGVVAARLPKPSLLTARRKLARALHPDLFQSDPAAAMLATEILKQLNALADK